MKNGETKRIYIGEVGVDSGQLVVCDPCYIGKSKGLELNDYKHMLELRAKTGGGDLNKAKKYLQLKYDLGHNGLGVVFDSGFGDGVYPVYATIKKFKGMGERIVKIEILMGEEME